MNQNVRVAVFVLRHVLLFNVMAVNWTYSEADVNYKYTEIKNWSSAAN
jgi:hypothetical protein